MTSIWWVRRDLRLHDNPALVEACASGDVIPAFIVDPVVLQAPSNRAATARRAFFFAGLRALDRSLRDIGSRLVVRSGDPAEALHLLVREAGAARVVAVEDASVGARTRDERVARVVPLVRVGGVASRPLADLARGDGAPHRTYRGFRAAWLRSEAPSSARSRPAPVTLPRVPATLVSLALPEAGAPPRAFPAGEAEALRRFRAFVDGMGDGGHAPIERYHLDRDRPGVEGTSALSPYLHFGMLSPGLAVARAGALAASGSEGAQVWLDELIWREFSLALLRSEDGSHTRAGEPRWLDGAEHVATWQQGKTGYPLVDAGMRQLLATGWMHNRVRMVTASFLVKHLLCDWRIGEQWFMDHLIDGDRAANRGGWRWVAGLGTNAAPYFRVMNPVAQARRFDTEGAYVRRWVPELRHVAAADIFEPWRREGGAPSGYPEPVVGLVAGRERALAAYRAARGAGARPSFALSARARSRERDC